ncbi:hypothetical protein AKUH3B206M_14300 [Apilactobacillus kunkeei]|nr:hypothetical protein AKUH3B206M_14300 [Apilactobacillus kunkeei]
MEGQVQVLNKSKEEAKDVAEKLLDKVGMLDKADSYQVNYQVDKPNVLQLLDISNASEYILLDEPTSAWI